MGRYIDGGPVSTADDRAIIAAGLETERRLYQNALDDLNRVQSQESTVVTFLTAGSLVATTTAVQVVVSAATTTAWTFAAGSVVILFISIVVLTAGALSAIDLFRGREVTDLSGANELFEIPSQPRSSRDVQLLLIAEYRRARISNVGILTTRHAALRPVLRNLVLAVCLAFLATSLVLIGNLENRMTKEKPSYTKTTMAKPSSTSKPAPIVIPEPGKGTVMIRGGGGDGTVKTIQK